MINGKQITEVIGENSTELNSMLKKSNTLNQVKNISKEEIETLLKRGIVGFLENTSDGQEYFAQSIEEILSKNSRKIQYNLGDNTNYSKTKFSLGEDQNDIDLNAPDFW